MSKDRQTAIAELAASIHTINQQAVREYTPLVEEILRSRSQDKSRIEHTLDGLLDFCGHEPALQLFRRLCRYYWDIDSATTASYVEAYRTTWDSEEETENVLPKQQFRVHVPCDMHKKQRFSSMTSAG